MDLGSLRNTLTFAETRPILRSGHSERQCKLVNSVASGQRERVLTSGRILEVQIFDSGAIQGVAGRS
jgi:hypothetical protein